MYDELIAALRFCDNGECDGCCKYIKGKGTECYTLLRDAADAIEELQQTVEHYKGCSDDWYREACDYKAMLPRWIPVTVRLPEDGSDILAVQSCCGEARIIPANYDRGVWYDCIFNRIAEHITHWMPLPQLPKEEN